MARILCLCSRPPYPPNDGARVRMYNLAGELSRNHEVDVVAISQDDEYETPDGDFGAYRLFEEHPVPFIVDGPCEYVRHPRELMAPLQTDGEYQNKILEAVGLDTLDVIIKSDITWSNVTKGTDLLVRDELRAIARAVIDVLNDRDMIKQQYTWESTGEVPNEQIDHTLSTRQQRNSETDHTNNEIQ